MTDDNPQTLRIEGELTVYTVARHKSELFPAVGDGCGATELDLSQVSEMDTAGLQLLLAARSLALARGGGLKISQPSPAVRDVLELCRLEQAFGCVSAPTETPRRD